MFLLSRFLVGTQSLADGNRSIGTTDTTSTQHKQGQLAQPVITQLNGAPSVEQSKPTDTGTPVRNLEQGGFEAFMKDFNQIQTDEHRQLFYSHYYASNEPLHAIYVKELKPKGGVFIGVGTDQNFIAIPLLKSDVAIFVDFDQWIVDLHKLYNHLFISRKTAAEMIRFFAPKHKQKAVSEISRVFKNAALAARLRKVYIQSRPEVYRRLTGEVLRHKMLKTNETYLTSHLHFDYMKKLAQNGRYISILGDLTRTGTFNALAKTLKQHNFKVGAIGLTNAEQYFKYGKTFRQNMMDLPWQEDGLVIRTYRKMPERYYEYFLQNWRDFKVWLERSATRDVTDLLKTRKKGSHHRLFTLQAPPKTQ
jgi:hypothetical protein